MAFGTLSSIGRLWRRYRVVIIFPTIAGTTIFADIIHTRRWKAQKLLEKSSS
ncbi:uncharacterized protein [Anabrus simplex]|uniref:uncharacterized protein n=1 Tax=Anabrus simplex TaxID=316456 RepID=UPI0035A2E8F5